MAFRDSRADARFLLFFFLTASVLSPLADETAYIFQSTNLIRLKVEIPESGIQELMQGRREPRVRVPATVTEGTNVYTNVLVQLKGRGSYQPIGARPNLTLHFTKKFGGPAFHGLRQFSLNNSSQDPTCLQEKVARELFARAGVPAARADNAFLTLNGRPLGVYVLTEGYDKPFLKRYFKRDDGSFYDGGLFTDIDQQLEVVSGSDTNYAGLRKAVRACFVDDDQARFDAISGSVDLDKFLSLIALETILCHFDGYAMRRTNYRVYHDPASNKLVFMPQGMDRVLGNFRSNLDLPVVSPMVGMVARALLGTAQGRKLYLERVEKLYRSLFHPEQLVAHVHELDRKIAPAITDPAERWGPNRGGISTVPVSSRGDHAADIDDLCQRITIRADYLHRYLTNNAALLAPTFKPDFSSTNTVYLHDWFPKGAYFDPAPQWEKTTINGTNFWHVVAPGPYTALATRVRLPAGHFHLSGLAKSSAPRIMLRYFFSPFTSEVVPLDWERLRYNFQVVPGSALEEVEILWEIRGKGEVWIDTDSFRLRMTPAQQRSE